MGDYDVVRLSDGKEGKPLFSRVKMEPGRAVLFSLLERADPEAGKSRSLSSAWPVPRPPASSILRCS